MPLTLSGTSGVLDNSGALILSTAVSPTSGTTIDFTGIPSWAKRVTVIFYNLSTNGTSAIGIQVGSGSVQTTGYASASEQGNGGLTPRVSTTFFYATAAQGSAAGTSSGHVVLTKATGNNWTASGVVIDTSSGTNSATISYTFSSGAVSISAGALDRVRILTTNGTDIFDAGSVNILYE